MIVRSERDIVSGIKGKKLKSPFLIIGSEEYLKEQYVKRLLGGGDDSLSSFNSIKMDFSEFCLPDFLEAVTTPPFMAKERQVLVFDFAPKDCGAELLKGLSAALLEQYEDCCVVFLEKSGMFDEKKDEKSKKIIKLFDKAGSVLVATERSESDIVKMLRDDAKSAGCELSSETAGLLLEYKGRDILSLKNEILKLTAYKTGGTIEKGDVMALTARRAEDNIFGLSKAILRGDYNEAMDILSDLFYLRYPPESILGTLSQVYIDIYRAKAAGKRGSAEIAADFGYGKRSFVIESAMRHKKLSDRYVEYALKTLSTADQRLKSTQNDQRAVMEWAVSSLFKKEPQ